MLRTPENAWGITSMQTENEPSFIDTPAPGQPIPFWVWLLVVTLGGIAAYATYEAMSARHLYHEGERLRGELAQQRDRLQANVTDLNRQVEQANRVRGEVENALKQSRADTEAASTQITELQKQVSDQQRQIADLEKARDTALGSGKDAAEAKAAADKQIGDLEKETAALKKQVADMQKKLNAALADLKKEREQISPAPMPPPGQP